MTTQRPRQLVFPIIFVVGVAIVTILILFASKGTPPLTPTPMLPTATPIPLPSPTPRPKLERRSPEPVYQRTLDSLRRNDIPALYNEISPGLAATFDFSSFREGIERSQRQLGPIIEVRPISPPMIKTEAPWNGEWADAEVEIVRERGSARYLVRFHREGSEWWLFGTLELK